MSEQLKERPNITIEGLEEEFQVEKPKTATIFDEKNYLNTRLAKGETEKKIKIRLLPIEAGANTPFKKIYTHNVKVPLEISPSGWKSYVCLEKTECIDHEKYGKKCPFCEMNRDAYKAFQESTSEEEKALQKEISYANKSSESCIIRCIERGKEQDGPKFWKFNIHPSDLDDPKNIILKLYKTRQQQSEEDAMEENNGVLPEGFIPENILDIYTGKDLEVTISVKFENGKPTNKTNISIVDYGKNKPISNDTNLIDAWVNDKKKWTDVFGVKGYDYLDLILNKEIPFYDKTKGKWVSKIKSKNEKDTKKQEDLSKAEEEIDMAQKQIILDSKVSASKEEIIEETQVIPSEDYESELPF